MEQKQIERAIERLNRRVHKHVFSYITPTVIFECANEINFIVPAKGQLLKVMGFVRQGELEDEEKDQWTLSYSVLKDRQCSIGQYQVAKGRKCTISSDVMMDENDLLNVQIDGPNILESSITVLYRIEVSDLEMKQWLISDLESAHLLEEGV